MFIYNGFSKSAKKMTLHSYNNLFLILFYICLQGMETAKRRRDEIQTCRKCSLQNV